MMMLTLLDLNSQGGQKKNRFVFLLFCEELKILHSQSTSFVSPKADALCSDIELSFPSFLYNFVIFYIKTSTHSFFF